MPKIKFRPNPTPPPFPPPIPPTPVWPYITYPGYEVSIPIDGLLSLQTAGTLDPQNITKGAILLYEDQVFVEEIPCTYKTTTGEVTEFTFDATLSSKVQKAINKESANFLVFRADGTIEQYNLAIS